MKFFWHQKCFETRKVKVFKALGDCAVSAAKDTTSIISLISFLSYLNLSALTAKYIHILPFLVNEAAGKRGQNRKIPL